MVRFRCPRTASAAAISLAAFFVSSPAVLAADAGPPAASAPRPQQHAHVHGVARLGVAVQDKTLTIQLESPLDSLIGFEHRPSTPAQQSAVAALQAKMRAPQSLFSFDVAAGCVLASSQAESAIFQPLAAGAASDEHADLDASFEFQCARPEHLKQLRVGLFAAYPRLKRLDVDVATDKGQFKRELQSPADMVALVR